MMHGQRNVKIDILIYTYINIGLPHTLSNLFSVSYEPSEIDMQINNIYKILRKFQYSACIFNTRSWFHVVQPFRSCTQLVRNSPPFTKSLVTLLLLYFIYLLVHGLFNNPVK
jgi:hypothetical protein